MDNLRFNVAPAGVFAKLSWKMIMIVVIAIFAMLAVSYNYGDDMLLNHKFLNGKIQRINE
uniref:PlxyGVORF116 protein n=1 Tax=Plutella xylostella granulovirus TaxID=98383 RepID=A0A1B2CSK1_9BBAC|nr:PlxyGVORF116 protein [Plutella xylostella granulovirus]